MKAIATTFNGVKYRSRLEARFAEHLSAAQLEFVYEPDNWKGEYRPDFWIPDFKIFVEVKPLEFLHEIRIFWEEIFDHESKWMCVDRADRDCWRIIGQNLTLTEDMHVELPSGTAFKFHAPREEYEYPKLVFLTPLTMIPDL